MTQAERGLFERIDEFIVRDEIGLNVYIISIKKVCEEFEQRLAEAERGLEFAKSHNNRDEAERHQLTELRCVMRGWHQEAVKNGYDGIGHALDTLFALQKGPRELTAPLPEKKA